MVTSPHRSMWSRLAACTLAITVVATIAPIRSVLADTPSPVTAGGFGFAVQPYAEPGSLPRDFLQYTLSPGESNTDKITLLNGTDQPKDFYLYGADAFNTSGGGGFALRNRGEPTTDVGAWVSLPVTKYTVPAKKAAIIPVIVNVPTDAGPGDHSGGVVAEEIVAPAQASHGAGIQTIHRVAARVYVRVAGPLHPTLVVQRLILKHDEPVVPYTRRTSTTVTFSVANTGNVRLQPDEVDLTLTGLLGRTLHHVTLTRAQANVLPDTILPGNTITFTKKLTGGMQAFEVLSAKVTVKYEDPILHQSRSVTRNVGAWVVPWLLVAALLAGWAGRLTWRRWRRYRRDHPASRAGGNPPQSPSPEHVGRHFQDVA